MKELDNVFKVSEIQVRYKNKVKKEKRMNVKCSMTAFEILKKLFIDDVDYKEKFYALYLNRSNDVLGYSLISIGGISGTVVDPKIIFQIALKSNASSIILVHNHPSGNIKPSSADIDLTKKIYNAGKFLDIEIMDHLIITESKYYSFADEGTLY